MLEIRAKLKIPRSAYKLEVKGRLCLPFEQRRGGDAPVRLESGEEVRIRLPRGEVLRGGDLATASDGRVIEVVAEPEKLLQAEFASAAALAKAAYHLGSRHVPVEAGEGFLRVAASHELEETLKKAGATLSEVHAPFEPEVDKGHGHEHDHDHHHHHHHDY
ncbi:MAG: urease accessory protein UreE [Betaproteobacteria bacterium]|nr:urease accessory protein UreE [Betaproteobacteria bacterium]MDH5222624.1 urease accessory protein UreE [Betaproteobacteria bacterium]MDH5351871.1 urease accessory protein UreE [Betaproteobacteria bacterium]